jgi:hypothetical protein
MDKQYLRYCNLIVSGDAGDGLDLSKLTINFAIKKTDGQTPNTAVIKVYNLNADTQARIQKEFTRVTIQAGYQSNYGIVFDGSVKQYSTGTENGVDTFLAISAADGDEAYNFAVVNATIAAGAKQRDQIKLAADTMRGLGVSTGFEADETDGDELPRGKVMYGMARDYIKQSSQTSGCTWSIQDGKIQVIPLRGVLPNTAVELNSRSGLIGTPEQTSDGIKFRCLINPQIIVGGAVHIKREDIAVKLIETTPEKQPDAKKKIDNHVSGSGFYRVLTLSIAGNTRGNDWYMDGVGLAMDSSGTKTEKVQGQ